MPRRRRWLDSVYPHSGLFQCFDQTREIADTSDQHMIERARRYFGDHGSQPRRPAFRYENTMDAGCFGSPQDCAQVVRIFDAIKNYEERRLAAGSSPFKNLFRAAIGLGGD